jgi:hypothetical protein
MWSWLAAPSVRFRSAADGPIDDDPMSERLSIAGVVEKVISCLHSSYVNTAQAMIATHSVLARHTQNRRAILVAVTVTLFRESQTPHNLPTTTAVIGFVA